MQFDLKQPCKECPFRTDCMDGWLGEARAVEIATSVLTYLEPSGLGGSAPFPCHKTVDHDNRQPQTEQHCAGAMILLRKIDQPNAIMQVAERLGFFYPDRLAMDAPVFDTPDEFIGHHT